MERPGEPGPEFECLDFTIIPRHGRLEAMRLLLVEDKDSFRRLLVQALAESPWDVTAVGDPEAALVELQARNFELLVTDLRLPGFNGLELLRRAKRLQPALRVLLMSAFGEPQDIVEAMRAGADDFLPKPFDLDQFSAVLERLGALASAPPPDPREPWVVLSPALRSLESTLLRATASASPVLFTGERGTGRSRFARRLHSLRHPQAPFVPLDGAHLEPRALQDALRLAAGGSLFLNGLEAAPAAALAALPPLLDRGDPTVHWLITSTTLDALPEALRLRLEVIHVALPPLSQRREEILPLFRLFIERLARRDGRTLPLIDRALERELLEREWPGNLRELAWVAEGALRANPGPRLLELPESTWDRTALLLTWPPPGPLEGMLAALSKQAEGQLLRRGLELAGGDLPRTAEALGLSPRTLALRLREHRISIEDEKGS